MKYYLSSFEIGNEKRKLKAMIPNKKIGYIGNARDFTGNDSERKIARSKSDMDSLKSLDLMVEDIDLKKYFGKKDDLKNKLLDLGAVFISGGNVFVLRQAMKLSGLDGILIDLKDSKEFVYAGYSAAGCVLSPSLKGYELVDPVDTPYPHQKEVIWEGLGLVDFYFTPHYKSNHPESHLVDLEIEYCEKNNIKYKALRDGEVIIIE